MYMYQYGLHEILDTLKMACFLFCSVSYNWWGSILVHELLNCLYLLFVLWFALILSYIDVWFFYWYCSLHSPVNMALNPDKWWQKIQLFATKYMILSDNANPEEALGKPYLNIFTTTILDLLKVIVYSFLQWREVFFLHLYLNLRLYGIASGKKYLFTCKRWMLCQYLPFAD